MTAQGQELRELSERGFALYKDLDAYIRHEKRTTKEWSHGCWGKRKKRTVTK